MPTGDERFTGADAIIKIPQGNPIPVSNVSWDRNVNTSEVQHTGTGQGPANPLKPTIAISGLRYSGSFEYDGKNEELRNKLWRDDGEPKRVTMTVEEKTGRTDTGGQGGLGISRNAQSRTITFINVLVEGQTRDVPSDDVTSTSWDWVAEDMIVS